jgi:hypothetical protein
MQMTFQNRGRKAFAREQLAFEQLEQRELMAGNVTASVQGKMLLVLGDAAANGVTITYNAADKTYRVIGKDAGGSPTTVNGLDTSQPANVVQLGGVKNVAVYLGGGDDEFSVGSPQAVDTVIAKWLSINMAEGNDKVTLGTAGNDPGGSAPVTTSLRTGTSVTVDLGEGNDQLSLAQTDIGLSLNVIAGNGDDDITFATEFTPTGSSTADLFPVRVRGHAKIVLAGGADELNIKNTVVDGDLRITDFSGVADIALHNLTVRKLVDIDTGNDADQIAIDMVQASQLTIDTNGGVDDVDLTKSRFRTVNMKLGGARDTALLRNVTSTSATYLDGGADNGRLTLTANVLRGLLKRNFG